MYAVARLLNDGNTNKGNTMETSARHRIAATSGGMCQIAFRSRKTNGS